MPRGGIPIGTAEVFRPERNAYEARKASVHVATVQRQRLSVVFGRYRDFFASIDVPWRRQRPAAAEPDPRRPVAEPSNSGRTRQTFHLHHHRKLLPSSALPSLYK